MERNEATDEGTIYQGLIILARIIARAIIEETSTKQDLVNQRAISGPHIESTDDIKVEQDKRLVMSVSEVAGLLALSRNAVYQAVHSGQIPSIRIGTRIIVPRVGLSRFLEGAADNENHEI